MQQDERSALLRQWGLNVKVARIRKDWKQEELGEALGTTQQTVARWELGQSEPGSMQKLSIAEALDVDVNELFPLERVA